MISPIVTAVCRIIARIKDSGRFDGPLPLFPAENYLQHEGNGPYESERVLDAYTAILIDDILGTTERVVSPNTKRKVTVRKVDGFSDWNWKARCVLLAENAITERNFGIENDTPENLGGHTRTSLIYNGVYGQVNGFRNWLSSTQSGGYLNLFPAARLTLGGGGKVQCLKHGNWLNAVKRFDDVEFWISMNSPDIRGYGVPWSPFGLECDIYQSPVRREEAERLGLVRPGEALRAVDATRWGAMPPEAPRASVKEIPAEIKGQLKADLIARFGPDIVTKDGKLSLAAVQKFRDSIGRPRG